MPDFVGNRELRRFYCLGMDLNRPVDALKDLKFATLKNVRTYQAGRLEPRFGLTSLATGTSVIHSIRRLNNPRTSAHTYSVGDGTNLKYGSSGVLTGIDTDYSGDPLALVPYRPTQAPDSWMYVADSLKMRKMDVNGTVHQVGLPQPIVPPTSTVIAQPKFLVGSECEVTTNWSVTGKFSGLATILQYDTTIGGIVYDTGVAGWCSICPVDWGLPLAVVEGSRVTLNAGGGAEEIVTVHSIHPYIPATTIANIIYDSGANGACSIVLSTQASQLETGCMLYNITQDEYAVVQSVAEGFDKLPSVRAVTTGTWVATDSVRSSVSFRCYTVNTQAIGNALQVLALQAAVTTTAGTGTATLNTSAAPVDFTVYADATPVQQDDIMELVFLLSDPAFPTTSRISKIKLMLDIANDPTFTVGYFSKDWTINDTPTNVMTALPFSVNELTRYGIITEPEPFMTAVYYIRIEVTLVAGGAATFVWDSIGIRGSGGLNVPAEGSDYLYRYRARCSTTGAMSNWSPASRYGQYARRNNITITMPQYTAATEADVLDIQRFGGVLPAWHWVGATANSATPTFIDKYPDDIIAANASELQVHYQPWPILSVPVSGVAAANGVAGTTLISSTSTFALSWAPGTQIQIDGIFYTIYRVISTSKLEVVESAGNASGVTWKVPEPIIMGQPLPCMFGPIDDVFFGCGDTTNPQRLYWANSGDPDSTQITFFLDLTSPSEPLQNGVIYNGRVYVWSTERMFVGTHNSDGSWVFNEIPNGKGLYARWAYTGCQGTPGPILYFLGKDGIYATEGGQPVSLTDDDLRPLFPNEGNVGMDVNTIEHPGMVAGTEPYFRLAYYDDYLYFDYPIGSTLVVLLGDSVTPTDNVSKSDANLAKLPSDSITLVDAVSYKFPYLTASLNDNIVLGDSVIVSEV
jgi:hypothetical protein